MRTHLQSFQAKRVPLEYIDELIIRNLNNLVNSKTSFILLQMEAPINVRIRIWFLITAAQFELKRRREIEFVLPSVASNKGEHVRTEKKKNMFKFEGVSDNVLQERSRSELPINKFYASRNLVKLNFLKCKAIFKIFVEL